jgi:hypothetical protein
VLWEPAGTLLWCDTCEAPVFPPGLESAGPVEGDPRRVPTRAERDDAALELAERRAVVLDAVTRVLAAEDLRADSRGRLGWFADQIRAASTMGRLAELVDRLAGERIHRARWYSRDVPNPVEISAAIGPDEDDYGAYEPEDPDDERRSPMLTLATPTAPVESRHEFDLRGYRIDPDAAPGHCQVRARSHYSGDPEYYSCAAAGLHAFAGVRVCGMHHGALSTPLDRR